MRQAIAIMMAATAVPAVFGAAVINPRQVPNPAAPAAAPAAPAAPGAVPADGTFSNGLPVFIGMPPENPVSPSSPNNVNYGARDIDIPYYRLHTGNIKFFSAGQLNSAAGKTDLWTDAGGVDSAKQSACGIPDNAFYNSKVAIHPYFLKYAPLDRYCQPDVCISFWQENWGPGADMLLKVTDICSTDPSDPTYCATPSDIKIDRTKAKIWSGQGDLPNDADPEIQGDSFPRKTTWFFVKCWGDGMAQPAYTNNWFSQPALINNLKWAQTASFAQYQNNQINYPAKGWPIYDNGGYNPDLRAAPLTDWVPGAEPAWTPIRGGQGFGIHRAGAPAAAAAPGANATSTLPPPVS